MTTSKASASEAAPSSGQSSSTSAPTRRSGLSCSECRRSKLKCDRTFPCQACIRRGCAAICPDGTLAATKGNKVLAAHAEKLTERVKVMSARIKELETALADANRAGSSLSHCHLRDSDDRRLEDDPESGDQWEPNYPNESAGDVSDLVGTMSVGLDGQRRGSGEVLKPHTPSADPAEDTLESLPTDIVHLSNAFPFGIPNTPHTTLLFANFIPSREQVARFAELYYTNAAWFYDPIIEKDFQQNIFDPIYSTTTPSSSTRTSILSSFHPHSLAIFFLVVATGSLFGEQPFTRTVSEQYYALARAAFSLKSIVHESSVASVQALFMFILFKYYTDRSTSDNRWLLSGLCHRLGHTFGLHRDPANWNLTPEEVQRRRQVFWEFYTYDSWTCMVLGRPPGLSLNYADCNFPEDNSPHINSAGEVEFGYHSWKHRYAATCVSACVPRTLAAQRLPYTSILDLDKRIRTFPTPQHLQSPVDRNDTRYAWKADPSSAVQQCCHTIVREANLMHMHRSFLVQALQDPDDPLKHKYAPSVRAAYRGACQLVSTIQSFYAVHPDMGGRVWFFWSSIFSACIILAAVIIHKPGCSLGQGAFLELGGARLFFKECSHNSQPSAESLKALDRLYERSKNVLQEYRATGVEPMRARPSSLNGSPSSSGGASMAAMNTPPTPSTTSLHHSHQYTTSHEQVGNTSSHSDAYSIPNAAQANYSSFATVGGSQMMTEMGNSSSHSHTFEMSPPIVPSQSEHQGHLLAGLPLDPMYCSTSSHALSSADNTGHSTLNYGVPGTGTHYGIQPPEPMPYHSPTFAPYMDPATGLAKFSTGEGDINIDPKDGNKAWTGFVQQLF